MILQKIKNSKKTFIVAEIGNNHEGIFSNALKMIDLAIEAKVDAVKFQTYVPELFIDSKYNIQAFKRYKKFQLSYENFEKLSKYCKKKKIIFFSTPLDIQSALFLNKIQKIFKISSFDLNYYDLIRTVSNFNKDMIISTGFSDMKKIKKAKKIINSKLENNKLAILHCVSSYPAINPNLKAISHLKEQFKNNLIGYSDHTIGYDASLIAVSLGAKIIEKHFTLNNNFSNFRDHQLSLNPSRMSSFVSQVRKYEKLLGEKKKIFLKEEITVSKFAQRYAYANKNLSKGEFLSKTDFYFARGPNGLNTDFFEKKKYQLKIDVNKNYKIKKKNLIKIK